MRTVRRTERHSRSALRADSAIPPKGVTTNGAVTRSNFLAAELDGAFVG